MAQFKVDFRDHFFNLFELLNCQQYSKQFSESELKETFSEFVKFVTNEIYPTRTVSDLEGVKLEGGRVKVAPCLHKPMRLFYENGWFGLGISEKFGGIPVPISFLISCVSTENSANVAFTIYHWLARSASNVIIRIGSENQKQFVIPKMNSGEWGGTMCLTEPNAGSDVGALTTMATPISGVPRKYKLKGSKIFISGGDNDLYQNIVHLVLARTPGAPAGSKGLSLFTVSQYKILDNGSLGDWNNVSCNKIEEKMGIHSSATCELLFGQDGECEGELLGELNEGMANMFYMMNEARLLCALQGEGQGYLAYTLSEQYANERQQFGTEIANHPDIKRTLKNMRALSRGLRALCLYTGHQFDVEYREKKHDSAKSKAAEIEVGLLTPICKAYGTDEGFNMAVDAVQIHGGYGFCSDYGIELIVRDTKIGSIYEGTNGIQALDFLTRKILKDNGVGYMGLLSKIEKTVSGCKEWRSECALMVESLGDVKKLMKIFQEKLVQKKSNEVFYHATDFLKFNSHLVVAWRLL
ncbi:MAG: hypothetical protein A2451_03255, partial [Bdellovibrionales bacterium RIFOXYC2_FULL_39_8]